MSTTQTGKPDNHRLDALSGGSVSLESTHEEQISFTSVEDLIFLIA